jgi:hypothetical protein
VISWADLPHAHAANAKQIRDATAVKPQKAVIVVGLSVVQGMNGRQIPPMEEMPCNNTVVPAGPSRAGPPDCGRAGRTSRMEFDEAAEALSLPASRAGSLASLPAQALYRPYAHSQGIMQAAAGVIRILAYYSTMGIPGSSFDS